MTKAKPGHLLRKFLRVYHPDKTTAEMAAEIGLGATVHYVSKTCARRGLPFKPTPPRRGHGGTPLSLPKDEPGIRGTPNHEFRQIGEWPNTMGNFEDAT